MRDLIIPADAELTTLMKVEKVDGTVRYLKQPHEGPTVEITKEQYEEEGGQ